MFEVVENFDEDPYRTAYTVRFEGAIYVLHAFQKKSPSGIRTAAQDVETMRERLKRAREDKMSGEADKDVVHGSTNVFADLGLPDPVERQTKTRLAIEVNELLKQRRLKQLAATRVLGIPQPKVSALANCRLNGVSVEKLMDFLTLLNQDVEILIRPARETFAPGHVSVHAVR